MILSYSDFGDKTEKTALRTIICFWVAFPNDTNWELIIPMQQSYVQGQVKANLFSNTQNLILPEKIC